MKKCIPLIFATLAIFCSGCVSTRQYVPFPDQTVDLVNPEMSRIYIMRPSWLACAVPMHVKDGNLPIGKTGAQGFLCWERAPGEVELSSKSENTSRLNFTAERGEAYYILQSVQMGILIARTKLGHVSPEYGKETLGDCSEPIFDGGTTSATSNSIRSLAQHKLTASQTTEQTITSNPESRFKKPKQTITE